MDTQSLEKVHEPYVRGPHLRYFIMSMVIGLIGALLLFTGLVVLFRLVVPFD